MGHSVGVLLAPEKVRCGARDINTEKFTECTQPGETELPPRHPGGQDSKPGMGSRGGEGRPCWVLGSASKGWGRSQERSRRGHRGGAADLKNDGWCLESPGRERSTGPLPPSTKSPQTHEIY